MGHAEALGVAGDAGGALGLGLDGDGAVGRVTQQPLDADRAAAGADVPQHFAAPWGEGRQRDGAHLAAGELAVMLEQRIRQAAGQGDDRGVRGGAQVEGDEVQRMDVGEVEAVGGGAADAFGRAAEGFHDVQHRCAEATVAQ